MAGSKKYLKVVRNWLVFVGIDLLSMLCLSLVTIILKLKQQVFRQSKMIFPMRWSRDMGWYGPEDISYPQRPLILKNVTAGFLLTGVPIAIIVGMQAFVRSFWDANAAILGLLKGTFIQTSIKEFLGVYRPYFIDACNPNVNELDATRIAVWKGPLSDVVWAPITICQNHPDIIKNAVQSYPSGHTGTAFTVMIFMSLYLNAKLKAFADFHTSFWKFLIVIAPVIAAVFVSGTLLIDGNHHARDILLSVPIGVICGILAYRAQYYSAFSYLTNHIPLPYSGSGTKKAIRLPFRRRSEAQIIAETHNGEYLAVEWPRETNERAAMRNSSTERGVEIGGPSNAETGGHPSIELGEITRSEEGENRPSGEGESRQSGDAAV
ncbi:phosphatidic acid phosphatase type [Pseudocyphellaria aurata]|nr:phosphatidic acid phosphatase type [Pseudocyphellaria aurata]